MIKLNRKRTQNYLQQFDFESLFIEELGWDTVDPLTLQLEVSEKIFAVEAIAHKRGFTVYQCISEAIPERKIRLQLDGQLTEFSKSHLLIFGDSSQTEQLWMWVKQEQGKKKPVFHLYQVGKGAESLIQKLEALFFDIAEEDETTLVRAVEKVSKGFNVEQVTKQFFQDFEGLHQKFCLEIEGIEDESDRRWYASVLLNRLMFVYFLQRRYFLDQGNNEYLQDKLKICQVNNESFYDFLKHLFFEGFAKPEYERSHEIQQRLGKICYLNGGLFLRHSIEQKYPQIKVNDRAFEDVFKLFSGYSWHLNDRPDTEKDSNEVNPDVLGYIFEKYINQKEFGAYYTRPEITEYLCDRTINKLVLDRLSLAPLAQPGRGAGGEGILIAQPGKGSGNKDILQLIANLNTDQCAKLLTEILPTLTLLDPACGSGAFLVAAMKTLIAIYQQVTARTQELLENSHPLASLSLEEDPHPLAPSPRLGEGESEEDKLDNYWAISPELKKRMLEIARELRQKSTPSENILWQALRNRKLDGRKFRRQQPIGSFVVDFFCAAERLVVEIDGKIHESQKDLDRQRQELLESLGLRFVRLSAELVEQDISTALNTIQATFLPPSSKTQTTPLPPSPNFGEGLGVRALSQTEKEGLGVRAVKEKLTAWIKEAEAHPSLEYYIKKRIITDNLYGVDIMEEATEIAKLRLFLALVASAETVEDLEPLPNIDFNIMAGNSLIGLIRVDGDAFDSLNSSLNKGGSGIDPTQINLLQKTAIQGNLLNALAASDYQQILEDKNKSIALYKKHAFQKQDEHLPQEIRLLQLRDHIDKLNRESQAKLNQLLLAEFSTKLGIKYEEAQLEGKPKKRLLNIADIDALEPFHWGYHFDKVFKNGGFDAIIANPPWEIFKPQAKEFFAHHSDLVTKNKMDIKTFEKEQKKLLENSEIAQAWLKYQSKFPYVSSYYRSAEDYRNQISVVNGKKTGTDINLYKLFLERCYHLLRNSGECGIVIPSGIYTDLGTKQLREMLFSETQVTGLFCFENRKNIFEGVDSRFKFVVLSFEKGGNTQAFPTRFMRHEVKELLDFPNSSDIELDVNLIRRLSPDSLSIMEFKSAIDVTIAEKMTRFPLLGEQIEGKWNLKLNAEFHMTNDSYLFKTEPAKGRLPLYEGKMIHQFTHQFDLSVLKYWLDEKEARQAILGQRGIDNGQKMDYQDYRLGFRKIARNTDIRTMISAIISSNFCSENFQVALSFDENSNRRIKYSEMLFLCALWNSFVVDFTLRQRVTANINFFYVYQLTIPRLQKGDKWFSEIVERAAKLICTTPEFDALAAEVGLGSHQNGVTDEAERAKLRAELDGIIAHLYGLTETEFQHILSTFPIVPDPVKQNAFNAYRDVRTGLIKSKDKV